MKAFQKFCKEFYRKGNWVKRSAPFSEPPHAENKHFLLSSPSQISAPTIGERLRGNRNRGNRPERFWEGNLPLRGSLRGRAFRALQRFSEAFRGPLRGFQRPSQSPSQSAISLSELRVLLPLIVLPLKAQAPTKGQLGGRFGYFFIFCSALGLGEREEASEEVARGGPVLRKIEGGGFRGGAAEGGRALGECLWGGGGLICFFLGPKCPPRQGQEEQRG